MGDCFERELMDILLGASHAGNGSLAPGRLQVKWEVVTAVLAGDGYAGYDPDLYVAEIEYAFGSKEWFTLDDLREARYVGEGVWKIAGGDTIFYRLQKMMPAAEGGKES